MSDLRTRIVAVALQHKRRDYDDGEVNCSCESEQVAYSYKTGYRGCGDDDGYAQHLADAVIHDALTPEFLADLVIAAVRKAADDE